MNEFTDDHRKLLTDAMHKWGVTSQKLIWIEELSELIQVIAKRDRSINPSFKGQMEDEIADVDLCLDQMKILYPNYVSKKHRKIARLRRLVYDL